MREDQAVDGEGWGRYLGEFHEQHPGITEEILGSATAEGVTPYEWLLEVVPPDAMLLDLACGSGPLLSAGWSGRWIGVDRSPAELGRARQHPVAHVVRADAHRLPFRSGTFDVVACSMALMLIQPLDMCVAELARVVVPGGVVAVLLPGGPGPLRGSDLWAWTRLLVALRLVRFSYPNDRALRHADATLRAGGLSVESEDRKRFVVHVGHASEADHFVDSLYLPDVDPRRVAAAQRAARRLVGADIGVPLRRMVIRRAS